MKHNYLIGLGGSGGKIITELYGRLMRERGPAFDSDVECIAIDTDQGELNELAQLGVKKICISGSGNVGQYFNVLGDDVAEWCPNTANEGNFFSSSVFNGASQCRLKSRLCFSCFLKNDNNALAQALEDSLTVSSTGTYTEDAPPIVLIASSIAGGTGSGIFIQTALYIKKFFNEHNIKNVQIHGLFACPDLYKNVISTQEMPKLYANAYAVIRELNAFNLICGPDQTTAYGGKLEIDIEISTSSEGKLFEKDAEGRYGDKPYDILYFIDKVNSMSKILGGLPEYYKAMANMAYSHLYTDISESVLTHESNQMSARNMAPCAIYASAGAATLCYPYEDILRYFSERSIKESFDAVWTVLDRQWANYYKEKDAIARASGMAKYTPAPTERATRYMEDFKKTVKTTGITKNEFSFLAPMVERGGRSAVDALFALIEGTAASLVASDSRIQKERFLRGVNDPEGAKADLLSEIENASGDEKSDVSIFKKIQDIDDNLAAFCQKCITYVSDMALSFANGIFCEDRDLWDTYDLSDYGIIKGLLYNEEQKEWIHPVAARYLLYAFMSKLEEKIAALIKGKDTPADDTDDFYNYLVGQIVAPHARTLATGEDNDLTNAAILQSRLDKLWGGKKSAKAGVTNYFRKLTMELNRADQVFADALQYFAFIRVRARLANLIDEYELFFDNIDEFVKKAAAATAASETMHDNSRGVIYVCAGADVKRALYETAGRNIDTQTGETASLISKGLFDSMRAKAAGSRAAAHKRSAKDKAAGMEAFFADVARIVTDSAKSNTEIQGSLDKNAFEAILAEYALTYPEYADDETKYSTDNGAKNRLSQFIEGKMAGLSMMAAPFLVYDSEDTYSGMFTGEDENGALVEKPRVTNPHRYISHNDQVDASIRALIGAQPTDSAAVRNYYGDLSAALPKDTESQTISVTYVKSGKVDPYSILCYTTVHCLQPYQIKAFDEIKGGVYYKHYARKILDMENIQRYSETPHLDKRWHKHGVMPYINVAKEIERRMDLAKAFLYALCYGKIGYTASGSDTKLVYCDTRLGQPAEIIFYKGKSIPCNKLNQAMYWFADKDSLIEAYSAQFDSLIEAEIEKLSKYSETVGGYKTAITNYARILNQFKRNILRPISVTGAANGRTKKVQELEPIGILEFAWKLHLSEENECDKDYAELLVDVLCDIIQKYSKAPFNADAIKKKAEGSEAYINYRNVCAHIAESFVTDFAKAIAKKLKTDPEEVIEEDLPAEEMFDDGDLEDSESERGAFGRTNEDVVDNAVNAGPSYDFGVRGAVAADRRFQWAQQLFIKELELTAQN